jgi:hypothetical protein
MFETLATLLLVFGVDNENSLLDELMRGEWYDAIIEVYTQTLGPAFHVIIFLVGPILLGIKYQSLAPVSMAILATGIVFALFFEATFQLVFAIAAVLGLAAMLYQVVHK